MTAAASRADLSAGTVRRIGHGRGVSGGTSIQIRLLKLAGRRSESGLSPVRAANESLLVHSAKARDAAALAPVRGKTVNRAEGSRYTTDFPDSTEGTAMISPPDPETASPLEWNPGMPTGFPDFATRQFLSPSLRGGGLHLRKSRRGAGATAKNPAKTPKGSVLLPALSTSPSDGLEPDGLGTSGLSTSINQQ